MNPLLFPITNPCLFWLVAFVVNAFFGYQGIRIKLHETHNENIDLKEKKKKEWSYCDRILIQCSEYFIFNFVCGLAGFAAFYVECKIWLKIPPDLSNISGGTATLLVFLLLFAFLGIAGKLSFVFFHGKIFGAKT